MPYLLPNISQNLVDTILDTVDYPMLITDGQGIILRINRSFEDVLGWNISDLIGKQPSLLKSSKHDGDFFKDIWLSLSEQGEWNGSIWNKTKQGEELHFKCSMRAMFGENGQADYYVSRYNLLDLDETSQGQNRDELTGLPNRHLFSDRLEQAIIAARRIDKSVALLRIGLDHFSNINDGLGYNAGDTLLQMVSQRLAKCVRGSDTVARLNGDMFAMALQVTSIDDSVIVAEKVLHAMESSFKISQREVTVSPSIGISISPKDAEDPVELMKLADSAMHHAKKQGGNQYQFFAADMNQKAKRRIELENDIRHGLQNNEFVLYYQPKVSATTEKIVGAEALIRWISPKKGFMNPGEFIPVAEETGLISQIGSWVLKEAARQNKEWQNMGLPAIRVAVNVAAPQFRAAGFIDEVKEALRINNLDAKWLELEIVESMLMGDTEKLIKKLHDVRDLGCSLSIDDFGTGYSSLSYLTRFPITTLKIDRAFVSDLENDPTMAEIARAIIGMSQGLKLEVVAEGAETETHINFLKQNGCQTVQGFYYSRPLPAPEFAELLRAGTFQKT